MNHADWSRRQIKTLFVSKRQGMIRPFIALAMVIGLIGAFAVGASSNDDIVAAPHASPAASPAASPTGRSVSVTDSVTIELRDSGFDPVYVESTNGHPLTITLINSGTRRHAFRVDRYGVNVSLNPGERKTIVIEHPDLGDFPYYSDAPGDDWMTGTLVFYI